MHSRNYWKWKAPLPYPVAGDDEEQYQWNEEAYQADNTTGWELVTLKRFVI